MLQSKTSCQPTQYRLAGHALPKAVQGAPAAFLKLCLAALQGPRLFFGGMSLMPRCFLMLVGSWRS